MHLTRGPLQWGNTKQEQRGGDKTRGGLVRTGKMSLHVQQHPTSRQRVCPSALMVHSANRPSPYERRVRSRHGGADKENFGMCGQQNGIPTPEPSAILYVHFLGSF